MMKRWNCLIYVSSQADFDATWVAFQTRYEAPVFADISTYILKEWIDSCPKNFLRFYTDQYLYRGEAAISRTEASHWLLKQDLYVSTNDILAVLDNFKLMIDRQYANNKF
ncbi:hypothetical protein N7448_010125 [Penicillium atrosanguineum]|nr:hypothetical protein N7448_010125 [Penicillium atrosanguineum]